VGPVLRPKLFHEQVISPGHVASDPGFDPAAIQRRAANKLLHPVLRYRSIGANGAANPAGHIVNVVEELGVGGRSRNQAGPTASSDVDGEVSASVSSSIIPRGH